MSTMNLLEMNARYAVATSVLNRFRHWLQGREGSILKEEDKEIFLESITMNQDEKLSPKVILYSFRGFSDNEHSAAIELSDALSEAVKVTFDDANQKQYIEKLKSILETKNLNSVSNDEKESILNLILNTMQIISNQTDQKPDTSFAWKSL